MRDPSPWRPVIVVTSTEHNNMTVIIVHGYENTRTGSSSMLLKSRIQEPDGDPGLDYRPPCILLGRLEVDHDPRHFSICGSVRCAENLMTSSNLATVFAPCLLPPPNKAEMSEARLELRVLVLRAFIENPQMFGNEQ